MRSLVPPTECLVRRVERAEAQVLHQDHAALVRGHPRLATLREELSGGSGTNGILGIQQTRQATKFMDTKETESLGDCLQLDLYIP